MPSRLVYRQVSFDELYRMLLSIVRSQVREVAKSQACFRNLGDILAIRVSSF